MAAVGAAVEQGAFAVAKEGFNPAQVQQLVALVAIKGPSALHGQVEQVACNVAIAAGLNVSHVQQAAVSAAYSTGVREDNTQRTWTFELDGHSFYVIALGTEGTFVYDLTTDQWSSFVTQGYPIWNAEQGHQWDKEDRIVCADFQSPQLYTVDPAQALDEGFRPLVRTVTGLIELRGRASVPCFALYLAASLGGEQTTPATITLSMSDDQGQSFRDFSNVLTLTGSDTQDLVFRSLGIMKAPGRIFKITDVGGPLRISGADIVTPEE